MNVWSFSQKSSQYEEKATIRYYSKNTKDTVQKPQAHKIIYPILSKHHIQNIEGQYHKKKKKKKLEQY